MNNFFARNKDVIEQDAARRENGLGVDDVYAGRRALRNAAIIALDRIEADAQHREAFDEIDLGRLADNMKANGQLQPIRVWHDDERQKYIIIGGERRYKAAQLAGFTEIECVVEDGQPDESKRLRMQIAENLNRKNLKPLEEAKAFRDMCEVGGISIRALAKELHVSPSKVSRAMSLLALPQDIQDQIEAGSLSTRDALTLKIAADSKPSTSRKKATKRPRKQRKVRSKGITITVQHRTDVTDEMMREAVQILDDATRQTVPKAA